MYTVHTDVKMTRRKTMCHICDDTGDPIWSGGRIFEAFEQMIEIEQYHFNLTYDGKMIRVIIGKPIG